MNGDPAHGIDRQRRIYGRNVGIRLRPAQKKRLQDLLPRIRLELSDTVRVDPSDLFEGDVDVWLEIGFGGGEHLAEQAGAHPETGFLGVEPFIGGVAKLLARVEQDELRNVRVIVDDARLLLASLDDRSIGRAFVLFPDPWPKKRHRKRRIVNAGTVGELARVLKDGAELRLATDDTDYTQSMLDILLQVPDFEWLAENADDWLVRRDDWPATRYEQKALEAGRRPVFLRFRRRPR